MIDRTITISLIIFAVLVFWFTDFGSQGKVYDCSLAEIHPDYPIFVKEECRKLKEQYRKQEEIKNDKIYI